MSKPAHIGGVPLNTPKGRALARKLDAKAAAAHARYVAECEANQPDPAELLEDAVERALAAGIDRETIRAEIDHLFGDGDDDPIAAVIATARIDGLRNERARRPS